MIAEAHVLLDVRKVTPGKGKSLSLRFEVGDELYQKHGHWHYIDRRYYFVADWYEKRYVCRESGAVIWESGPLSQHQGRGSAKKRG